MSMDRFINPSAETMALIAAELEKEKGDDSDASKTGADAYASTMIEMLNSIEATKGKDFRACVEVLCAFLAMFAASAMICTKGQVPALIASDQQRLMRMNMAAAMTALTVRFGIEQADFVEITEWAKKLHATATKLATSTKR